MDVHHQWDGRGGPDLVGEEGAVSHRHSNAMLFLRRFMSGIVPVMERAWCEGMHRRQWAGEGWRQHWLQLWGFIGAQYLADCRYVYPDEQEWWFEAERRQEMLTPWAEC